MLTIRHLIGRGSAAVLAAFLLVLLATAPSAHAAGVSEAQSFAESFCIKTPDFEDRIADYMWVTSPSGGNSISVVEGQSQQVAVKIHFYVTYCKQWPAGHENGAKDMQVLKGSTNYLSSGPGSIVYEDRATPTGTRSERGTYTYDGTLDVSTWTNGKNTVCTQFQSTSKRSGVTFSPSLSACFDIYLTRISPWYTDGQSLVGVGAGTGFQAPNVTQWPNASTPHNQEPRPGDTLYFNHSIWNTTSWPTSDIIPAVGRSGFLASSGLNGDLFPYSGAKFSLGGGGSYAFGRGTANYNTTADERKHFTYRLDQDDVGAGYYGREKICQYVSWGPWWYGYQAGEDWKPSTPACVSVPFNFNLTPVASVSQTSGEPGASISPITLRVDNKADDDATTRSYAGITWQLVRFVVPKNNNPKSTNTGKQEPCAYYGNGCKPIKNGVQTYEPNSNDINPSVDVDPVDDAELGSQVCFALATMDYDQNQPPSGGNWRYGAADCVKVGKTPKLQVWGGDVATRGLINTSTTVKSAGIFGSWVEYGAFSVGSNTNFASSAGLANQTSSDKVNWNHLTFANVNSGGASSYGGFTSSAGDFRSLPNIASYFQSLTNKTPYNAGGDLNSNAFTTGGPVAVRTAGNLTLSGQLDAGKSLVIIASGTVTINGDIKYTDADLAGFRDLPQLVIIAQNIRIEENVKNVDAWLVASGYVDTCGNVGTAGKLPSNGNVMKGDVCADLLTINGPVVADKLVLKRTAGSGLDSESGNPGEIINLRPDAYLWAQQVASGSGRAQTVYSVELPPRF